MASRQELQENCRVNRKITSNANTPQRREAPNRSKIRRSCGDQTKDSRYAEGQVESPSSTEDVAAKAPEDGADEETNVLCQAEQGSAFCGDAEFAGYGAEDEGGYDGPEVVGGPAEADDDEELGRVRELLKIDLGLMLQLQLKSFVNVEGIQLPQTCADV
jgi:hypothetical protein